MRFSSIRLRGVIPFPGEVNVDFDAIPGDVLAIVGPNGAGKSTLVESLLLACRQEASRGSLADLSVSRDTQLEVACTNGSPWVLRHSVDVVSKKGEAEAFDSSGAMVLPSTKLTAFDSWAARTLPDPGVLMASTISTQGAGGLLAMTPAERKATILRALGIEQLEAKAADARERARGAAQRLTVVEARLADERVRATTSGPEEAEAELVEARARLLAAEEAEREAVAAQELLRVEAQRVAEGNARARELQAEVARAEARKATAEVVVRGLERQLVEVEAKLARAPEVQAAAARVAALGGELASLREKYAAVHAQLAAAKDKTTSLRGDLARAEQTLAHAKPKAAEVARAEALRLEASAKAVELPAARGRLADMARAVVEAESRIETLQSQAAKGADGRIEDLRGALATIAGPLGQRDAGELAFAAQGALQADDLAVERARSLPGEIDAARAEVQRARAAQDVQRQAVTALERAKAHADLPPATAPDVELLAREVERTQASLAEADAERERLTAAEAANVERGTSLAAERATILPVAADAPSIATAEAYRAAITAQLGPARAELAAAASELSALPSPPELEPEPSVSGADLAVRGAAMAIAERRARVGDAERAIVQAKAAADRLAALEAERAREVDDGADWTRLANDIAGVISAEVDAIGPELTTIANDLLHTCFGSRWTVVIETQRLAASGKKMIEGCEIRVLDSEDGREKGAERLSGGQAVIVGTAVRLALAQVSARRWGTVGSTLVLDESGAALADGMGGRYVAMVRRAMAASGFSKALLVTHSREVIQQSDAQIVVGDGKVSVLRS